MSVWTDPVILELPPITILMFFGGYFFNKIIDLKSSRKLSNDLERLDYVGDTMVNTSVKHGKKIKGAVKAIMSDNKELPSETIPSIHDGIDTEDATVGLVLSEMQLTLDMMKDDLIKQVPGLTFNNGEAKEEEST